MKRLYRTQKAYGDALGITAVQAVTADSPDVRAKMDEALAVLRQYAIQVVSHVDSDDAGSQGLADELLRRLIEWEDTSARAAGEGDEADVGAPVNDAEEGADDPKDEASGGEGVGSPPKK